MPKLGSSGNKSFFGEIASEIGKGFKELGNEIVKGVTMLPYELVYKALFGADLANDKDAWAKEWLGDEKKPNKPTISSKEGKYTKFDPLAGVRAKLAAQMTQSRQPEQQRPPEEQKQKVAPRPIMATSSKRKAGDWMHGTKRKRSPNQMELNRADFAAAKGAQ